ncbi:hypothetical protein GT370_13170 [Acidocella sp. MX-AZ03]|uniref:hypothetical protein n=1 Tax=Acidocella sp. MX-AZ03 TaxID=2697363 RepID=UPI0022DE81E4|nr:hypothetical protein [Acidocella sp. MX-AZ03]WBO58180.1 hypothetical protein GT370_13170 [Acidocella sp. MX-AZ03]
MDSIYQNFDDSSWPSNWFGCAPGSWTWPGFGDGDGDGDGSGKGGVTETGMTAYAIALTPGSGGSATASILSPLHIAVSVTSTATGALANLLGDVNTAITGESFKLNIGDFSLPSYYYGTATIDGVSGFIANTLPGGPGSGISSPPAAATPTASAGALPARRIMTRPAPARPINGISPPARPSASWPAR